MKIREASSKVTNLERLLINFATPVEFLVCSLDGSDHSYFENGAWRGLVDTKVGDYKRLLQAAKGNQVDQRVLELYRGTTCGCIMVLTYKLFH